MDILQAIATSGGPAGLLATILIVFLKREKKESDCRHTANDAKFSTITKDLKDLRNKSDTVQKDLSDIKIQMAKISTAMDLLVLGKAEKTN